MGSGLKVKFPQPLRFKGQAEEEVYKDRERLSEGGMWGEGGYAEH